MTGLWLVGLVVFGVVAACSVLVLLLFVHMGRQSRQLDRTTAEGLARIDWHRNRTNGDRRV